MTSLFILLMLLVSQLIPVTTATYRLVKDYSGDAFWQNFDFFTDPDPTDGHVDYIPLDSANSSGIAGFLDGGNSSYAIFMGVDTKQVAPEGRASVRVSSSDTFQHALLIADIVHMPGGICGTWPAFWMLGKDWPNNGEIDIIEGVNDQFTNSMTLHTAAGPVIDDGTFRGDLLTSNCDINAPDQPTNAGCSIGDISNLTFGPDFNNAGGGVFATEWTSDFIKIWFFPRGTFPSDIVASSPRPGDDWGTPASVFQGQFNMDDHFQNLQIIFDTTFCGQWAGQVWNDSECAALAPTCEEYVTNNPSAFVEAYWSINTLQVFQDDGTSNEAPDNGPPRPPRPPFPNGGPPGSPAKLRHRSEHEHGIIPIYM